MSGSEWWLLRGLDEINLSIFGCEFFLAVCEVVALLFL